MPRQERGVGADGQYSSKPERVHSPDPEPEPAGRVATTSQSIPMSEKKIRVLVAKPGLDGHDRGAKVIAAALRDAGMEVIYTGLHQTPDKIAATALQEDVDVVALSILSGAHMTLFPRVQSLLAGNGMEDVLVTGGGIIPAEDIVALREIGIGQLFGPGTPTGDAVEYIRTWYAESGRSRED